VAGDEGRLVVAVELRVNVGAAADDQSIQIVDPAGVLRGDADGVSARQPDRQPRKPPRGAAALVGAGHPDDGAVVKG
jgi:hypothetical protein